jgi:hypothetical protein
MLLSLIRSFFSRPAMDTLPQHGDDWLMFWSTNGLNTAIYNRVNGTLGITFYGTLAELGTLFLLQGWSGLRRLKSLKQPVDCDIQQYVNWNNSWFVSMNNWYVHLVLSLDEMEPTVIIPVDRINSDYYKEVTVNSELYGKVEVPLNACIQMMGMGTIDF